ncbi:MAG: Ldh family oxidoreductase [Anaerolineae bacterium]|nr:Ldh family oxidoreductase [Anaerolineae bacterium]
MKTFSADYLRQVGIDLFTGVGAPLNEATVVAEELVDASLMGLESHGVTRYIWYVEEALAGHIKLGAPVQIVKQTASTAVVDGGFNFGPVVARFMVDVICDKAKQSDIACVLSQNCHHIARIGSYVQKIALHDLFGFITVNSPRAGHFVVPWGGREGRLATNPMAYAVPTSGRPVVMDMSTSMIAEGKIRVLMYEGKQIPAGRILDANGNPTTDPKAFYGPPRGTILPLGSELGYKGFGLGLLVEILSGTLAGLQTRADYPHINGVCMIAINPEAFCGIARFKELMDDLIDYMTTTPPAPGSDGVVMPGDLDFRAYDKRSVEGIPLSDETWRRITEAAQRAGVTLRDEQEIHPR